jgi:HK97 family phage prohead protease
MDRTLARNPDVVLSLQHDMMALPLGRTKAGTFIIEADSHGLATRGELPDNEVGRPVRDAIRRKDLAGMSIRFRVPNERTGAVWSPDFKKREIVEAQLGPEISVVSFPAYTATSATVRSLAEAADLEPDELAEAFNVLRENEAKLTPEQSKLLYAAISVKTDEPHVPPNLAKARERLAALASKQ